MAMNKAEKAAFEALERDLAFRWPTAPEPDPMPAPAFGEDREGWVFNAYTFSVERRWSTSTRNGGFAGDKRSTHASQNAIRLYRTEADAYTALRWRMCRDMADKLHNVDKRLALVGDPA